MSLCLMASVNFSQLCEKYLELRPDLRSATIQKLPVIAGDPVTV